MVTYFLSRFDVRLVKMMENSDVTTEDRYDQVIEYLRESIENLVNSKMVSPNKKRRVDPTYVSSRLIEVLKNSLSSERETHLQELMAQLSKLNIEKENLERELIQIKGSTERETARYAEENEQLQKQFLEIENELKTIEWRQTTKESAYKEDLQKKQAQLQTMKSVIVKAHEIQHGLSDEVSDVKKAVQKMSKNQIKLIRRARELCTEKLKEIIEFESQKQNLTEVREIKSLQDTLLREKAEYRKNQKICQSLLNAIWAISNEQPLDITPENFTENLNELKQFIQRALAYHRENAVAELKEEVRKQIPDLELDSENVIESVQNYISQKIQEKDQEYQREIKRGMEREMRLKKQLQETLSKIEQIQAEGDDNSNEDEMILSDFEKTKEEWDLQKKLLDEKMKMLKMGSSLYSSKPSLNDD